MSALPPFPPPPRDDHRARNITFWLILGCGGMLFCLAAFVAGVYFFVTATMRNSEPGQRALQLARSDARVIAAIGQPVRTGWIYNGTITVNLRDGNANFTMPLSGPKDKASVHVIATKDGSGWHYEEITFSPPTGEPFSLLPAK